MILGKRIWSICSKPRDYRGGCYTLDGFSSAWQKLMAKAMKDKVLEQRYTFHDLRAKAGSESENAQDLLGHVTHAQRTKNAFVSCFGA